MFRLTRFLHYMEKDIPYTMEFLNKFFGNLLLGEKNLLENREMQIKTDNSAVTKSKEKSKEKILRLISENSNITTQQLSTLSGLSVAGVEKNLRQMKEQELIRRIGPDKGGHWEIVKK